MLTCTWERWVSVKGTWPLTQVCWGQFIWFICFCGLLKPQSWLMRLFSIKRTAKLKQKVNVGNLLFVVKCLGKAGPRDMHKAVPDSLGELMCLKVRLNNALLHHSFSLLFLLFVSHRSKRHKSGSMEDDIDTSPGGEYYTSPNSPASSSRNWPEDMEGGQSCVWSYN